jgi:putative transposase
MKLKRKQIIFNFREKIKKFNDKLIIPPVNGKYKKIDTNSCFDILKYTSKTNHPFQFGCKTPENKEEKKSELLKSVKIKMILNLNQKEILNNWFEASRKIYNETIQYIKNNLKKTDILQFRKYKKIFNKKYFIMKKLEKDQTDLTKEKKMENQKKKKSNLQKLKEIDEKIESNKNKIAEAKKNLNKSLNNKRIYESKINKLLYYGTIRTYQLKDKRNQLIEESGETNDTRIMTHIMDATIKKACANFRTCITNFVDGRIKNFRIKELRKNKKNKIIEIERSYHNVKGICYKTFENIKYQYNNKEYIYDKSKIKKAVMFYYDGTDENYYMILTEENKTIDIQNRSKYIGLDPGVRKFMTGLSESGSLKIGTDIAKIIKNKLIKLDNINSGNYPKKIKDKYTKRTYMKIRNMMNEVHWKTSNYLTNNYETIIIGDMNTKSITKKDTGKIDKMTKRIAYLMGISKFRERLKYKCQQKNTTYKMADESYTSMMCSKCGNEDKNLGGKKVYNCGNCKLKIDRDINGCRGILIKEGI